MVGDRVYPARVPGIDDSPQVAFNVVLPHGAVRKRGQPQGVILWRKRRGGDRAVPVALFGTWMIALQARDMLTKDVVQLRRLIPIPVAGDKIFAARRKHDVIYPTV
jgi:hypothetical protein